MKVIKIFSENQLLLLRNINPLLGKYRLPKRILKRMHYILEEDLGPQGCLIVIVTPVRDDTHDIEDAVNVYPFKVQFSDSIEGQEIKDMDYSDSKGREWFLEKLHIQETNSDIYVLYFILKKHLYRVSQ